MQLCTAVVVFMGFYYWTSHRMKYYDNTKYLSRIQIILIQINRFSLLGIYDTVWLVIYISYLVSFLVLPCRSIVKHELALASTFIVLLEQVGI